MENIETQIKLLDNYAEISGSGSDDSGHETFLIHCLSKLDLKNMNLPCHVESTTETQEIISNRIESGTQIVEKHERVSKSPEIADEIMRITRSTQAELSESHSSSVAVHNEVLSTSRISAEGTTDLSSSVGSEIKSLGVSLPSPAESLETSREQLSECPSIFQGLRCIFLWLSWPNVVSVSGIFSTLKPPMFSLFVLSSFRSRLNSWKANFDVMEKYWGLK